jgi:cell division protein FtsL
MTKKTILKILTGIAVAVIIVVLSRIWYMTTRADAQVSGTTTIGELSTELDYYKTVKNECLNELTFLQSVEHAKGVAKFCFEWDEQIISLREQITALSEKDYERAIEIANERGLK